MKMTPELFEDFLARKFSVSQEICAGSNDPNGIAFVAFGVGGMLTETNRGGGLCTSESRTLKALLGQVLLWTEMEDCKGTLYWRVKPEIRPEVVAVMGYNEAESRAEIVSKTMFTAYCRLSVSTTAAMQK
jgi:hypothetical protein